MFDYTAILRACCCLTFALLAATPLHADAEDAAVALHAAIAIERARDAAPRLERAAFLTRPTLTSVVLAHDGSQVAFLRDQGDGRSVWLQPASGATPHMLLARSDADRIEWTRDGRWLLLISARQIYALATAAQSGTGVVTTLGGSSQRELQGVDPVLPAAVIVLEQIVATRNASRRWQLVRIDIQGRRSVLHRDTRQIADFALASDGRLAFLGRVEGTEIAIDRVHRDGVLQTLTRCAELRRCSFLASSTDGSSLLLRSDLDSNLSRLVRLGADGSIHPLHTDPRGEADLDEVVFDPLTRQPLIAGYRSSNSTLHGLSSEVSQHLQIITAQLPDRDLGIRIGHGVAAHWLVREQSSALQGERWHLYNPDSTAMHAILNASVLDGPLVDQRSGKPVVALPESALARKLPISWRASDGMRLHGFLSLPPGVDPARLALVVNVHGGPWNQSRPGFSVATQFLVNRGYAVFEPNFRGSTGYGHDYLFAAHGDFGNGRVQQDIVDGVRYLLAQGVGDKQRVGIIGASFGGYTTLLGLTFAPELFKVGIAIAPPVDFGWDLRWVGRSSEALSLARYVSFADWLRLLSLDIDDPTTMARLHAQSPLANVAQLTRPLLLLAGGEDRRVAIRGVIEYSARLKLLGKDMELYVDSDAGHINDAPLAREAQLYLIERMLHRHLGGAAPTPPDAEISGYLQRTLRITMG